jgi:PAS domain S-box-containing protein
VEGAIIMVDHPRPSGCNALADDADRNRMLAEMAEQSTDMISRHTPEEWRFIYVSPAVTHLLGYQVEEIIGTSAYDLYHPDDVEDFKRRARSVNYNRGLYTHTYRFRCKDGHYTWLESTSRTIRDINTGKIQEILVVSRDVTHRILAEEQLQKYREDIEHAGRLITMGELASGLAHELNQPLAAMVNFLRGVERRFAGQQNIRWEEIELPITRSINTALRAGDIIHRMMDFTRRQEPVVTTLDIAAIVEEMCEFCESTAERDNVAIKRCIASDLPAVTGDKIQLEQVLLNLLINGIEASRENSGDGPPQVSVEVAEFDQNNVVVQVKDEGKGIAAGDLERIFERFYSTKSGGLGMGLAISRSLVETLGGELWAENVTPSGACFSFTLNKAR